MRTAAADTWEASPEELFSKRLNLDFSLGLGWIGGQYHEYLPMDDCYVWQSTSRFDYFGPTRLEISLVWLLGRGNTNN